MSNVQAKLEWSEISMWLIRALELKIPDKKIGA